ncbi:hypothetical protein GIW74_27465 [Pseudomonas syringae]|nr:hypothetical protein [Pseudomonas syringae]MCF5076965.1 hypothetical protein [Pseudomonas syringae]
MQSTNILFIFNQLKENKFRIANVSTSLEPVEIRRIYSRCGIDFLCLITCLDVPISVTYHRQVWPINARSDRQKSTDSCPSGRQQSAISRHLLKAAFDAKLAMAIPQTDSGPIR